VFGQASIIYLANVLKKSERKFEILAVDVWDEKIEPSELLFYDRPEIEKNGGIYNIYNNLKEEGLRDVITDDRSISWDVPEKYEDSYFDFVYIDAGHNYEDVCKDIDAWRPKIKKNGILSGHDYWLGKPVVKAVDEKIKHLNILPEQGVWWTRIT